MNSLVQAVLLECLEIESSSQDIIISINLLKMQILRPHSRHPELETRGGDNQSVL